RIVAAGAAGAYHATNKGHCSWYDLAHEALATAGYDPAVVTTTTTRALGRPAPRPAWSVLDNTRLECELHHTLPPWQDAVRRYASGHPLARTGGKTLHVTR